MSERAPGGLRVVRSEDRVDIAIHPFLVESGRNDLRMLKVGRWVIVGAGLVGLLIGDLVARIAALAVLAGGVGWMVWDAVRAARRQRAELTLTLAPEWAEVTLTTDGKVDRRERVDLRALGKASPVEAGYQRWHVVANVTGREPLVVEMERHDEQAAAWVAQQLADAGRRARQA